MKKLGKREGTSSRGGDRLHLSGRRKGKESMRAKAVMRGKEGRKRTYRLPQKDSSRP